MFYKIKNTALLAFAFVLTMLAYEAKSQGLVSLSEEAMFDDELESNTDFMAEQQKSEEKPNIDGDSNNEDLPSLEVPSVVPDIVLPAPKEDVVAPKPEPVGLAPVAEETNDELFSSESFNSDLFSKMSELEKKTTLMNLELKRERLQNEIEAVKNQRKQALQQEEEKKEAARLKALEKEKDLEKKLLVEQQKLRELDIKFETLRQEKLLASYKNKMLEENQKWIEHNGTFYKQIADLRQAKVDFAADIKEKMDTIKKEATLAHGTYVSKINALNKEKEDLQQQINILKDRLVFMEKQREEAEAAMAAARRNPFADGELSDDNASSDSSTVSSSASDLEPTETGLSQLYAVTEIRGKGDELVAKLINKNGTSFYVKKGTILQSGHVVKEITSTYVMAERLGQNDYLYFAAGGILPSETADFKIEKDSEED